MGTVLPDCPDTLGSKAIMLRLEESISALTAGGAASRLTFARLGQQRGQLCDVRRNSLGSAARLVLEGHLGKRLAVVIAQDEISRRSLRE
jgi:hypothetical protein